MKSTIIIIIALFGMLGVIGCQNYTQAKVGPDRYAFSSRGKGAADHTKILQSAYDSCRLSGYKDYVVLGEVVEDGGLTLVVQCSNASLPIQSNSVVLAPTPTTTPTPNQPAAESPSFASLATKMYYDLKSSINNSLK